MTKSNRFEAVKRKTLSLRGFFRISLACFAMILLLQSAGISAFAVDDGKMAYNIYSDPDVSKTSRSFDTFSIDFRGVQTPTSTYWALANWGMDLSGSRSLYRNASGGGAYAGLQDTGERKAIMSFWEVQYGQNQILRASRMYPAGADHNFGGEGEGTNWITNYDWKDNTWYRMVIHCWKDAETGTTFVGQWFQDQSTNKWTLISYFDTHLKNSFFTGGMSQFQENFYSGKAEGEREFNYKNLYALDHEDHTWKSLSSSTLSYDSGSSNKKGTHSFGATEEYFWGKANGIVLDDQAAYNKTTPSSKKFTIQQPDAPSFGEPAIGPVQILKKDAKTCQVDWIVDTTATPQLSYTVELIDLDGNVVQTVSGTRPETTRVYFDVAENDECAYKAKLTVTDIFGNTITKEQTSKAYDAAGNGEVSDGSSDGAASGNDGRQPSSSTMLPVAALIIVPVVSVVVAAVVIAVVVVVVMKKKGKKAQ